MLTAVFFASFLVLIFLSCPIGLSMLVASFLYLFFRGTIPYTIIAERITSGIYSFPLLAVPLFVLAGRIMNTAGITRRIFEFCLAFVGHLRAGLAYVNVLASMIFAGITGSSVADVAGLGAVEIKAMKEEGYDPGYSAAITAASSCIGPIVPPSIIMIVIGVMSEVSIGRLFAAGFVPGILMGLSLMALIYYHSHSKRKQFPKGRTRMGYRDRARATWNGLPAVLSPVIILGGIITGIVTPTEAGVIAVIYSTLLGFLYRELHFRDLFGVLKDAVLATGVVMLVIAGAQMLGWIVTIERIAHAIYSFIQTTSLSTWMILALINLGVIFLGCFIEGVAVIMIVVPVLLPAVKALGMSPVQFGAFLAVNIMIGLLTPPVGMSVYIASDIAGIPAMEGFRKTLAFSLPILVVLILTTYWPAISLYLPNLIFGP